MGWLELYWTLRSNEVIHHIDKDSTNDSLDNLRVVTRGEHASLHHKGKVTSEETKRKISQVKLGHPVSEETREKLRQARVGKTPTLGKHWGLLKEGSQ